MRTSLLHNLQIFSPCSPSGLSPNDNPIGLKTASRTDGKANLKFITGPEAEIVFRALLFNLGAAIESEGQV